MKTLVIVAYPDLTSSRVNSALAKGAKSVANVEVCSLYELYPDGKIDVATEQAVLSQTDHIVLQFPMYWYSTPALLKQWQDDVLTYGWAYGSKGKALVGKTLSVAVSLGASENDYQPNSEMGHTVDEFLLPIKTMARYTNMQYSKTFVVGGALKISDEQIAQAVSRYQAFLA
ncbi:NAD(P)H-dependent oxidoreductase [Actinobacillus arthritidis]|uniref:NAD(P)H-dependent oxidoreductase n=1 Tax=Actinobacillus arthritidis TaxID=157339 RepID=UPI0024415695|nr:NAD(P)H-dependent oxidoreductase [Actinobacillus arthritidis]WGE89429.1 NAD(P)H-dependent oxidoreductase [Actinobacillus arthritidis]